MKIHKNAETMKPIFIIFIQNFNWKQIPFITEIMNFDSNFRQAKSKRC